GAGGAPGCHEQHRQSQREGQKMLRIFRSGARWWALTFLIGTGFAMTLITSGTPQPAPPPLITCRNPVVQDPTAFPQPQVRQSLKGLLRTTFTACISTQTMLDQNRMPPVMATFNPPTFEGMIPAPTLSLKPGDKLSLMMINSLPSNPDP